MDTRPSLNRPRSKRLKQATHETHDRLDKAVMARKPFASLERYALFLAVQHAFHRDIDALYDDPALASLLPDLRKRARLGLIEQDLADLGKEPVTAHQEPVFRPGRQVDIPAALGWLYVAEGSNLGAAFLLKAAAGLGLGEQFGARHLAPQAGGRGLSWRNFTETLDSISLRDDEEELVITGATNAFGRVGSLVETVFGR